MAGFIRFGTIIFIGCIIVQANHFIFSASITLKNTCFAVKIPVRETAQDLP